MIYSVECRGSLLWDSKETVNKGAVDQIARHAGIYSSWSMSPLSAESSEISVTRMSRFLF